MSRHVQFERPTITSTRPPVYRTSSAPWVENNTHFTGAPSQAVIITPNEGKSEMVGWRFNECEFSGKRKWQAAHNRFRVEPAWLWRCYMMSDLHISKSLFRSRVKEHHLYCDLDFEHGRVVIEDNMFKHAMSQAIQIVGPWSRPYNSGWPERAENAGKLHILRNLIVDCGKWNYWAKQGISRPASALSVFRTVKKLSCYVHGNHIKSATRRHLAGFYSYGAMMFERTRYLELVDNLIQYKQPSNRDLIKIDRCDEVIAKGNRIEGGTVQFYTPNELIWEGNTGWGSVKWRNHAGQRFDLGPVTGRYVFQQGQPVVVQP